jgi:anti-anti-sigma factor
MRPYLAGDVRPHEAVGPVASERAPSERRREALVTDHFDLSEHRNDDGSVRIAVGGEVDTDTAGRLVQAVEGLLVVSVCRVVVDLTSVTFLDSSGIRALLTARRIASEHGAALQVTGVHGIVRRVLTLTGLLSMFTDDETEGSPLDCDSP